MTNLTTPPDLSTRAPYTPAYEPGSWSIHWKGDSWHESALTGQHLAWLCLLDGHDTWAHLDLSDLSELNPVHGPVRLMSLIVCCVAVRDAIADDRDLANALDASDLSDEDTEKAHQATMRLAALFDEVRSTPIHELIRCFTVH